MDTVEIELDVLVVVVAVHALHMTAQVRRMYDATWGRGASH